MIQRALRRVWRIFTAPFRWIAKPFLAFRDFLNQEPEDSPVAEVFAKTIENPGLLIDHVEALRRHLLRALAALIVAVAISTLFATEIMDWLSKPIGGIDELQAIEVTESIGVFMRVVLLSGFTIALPYVGFEVFAFMNPGLRRRERIMVLSTIPFVILLFLLGIAFTYYVMLPTALPFLLDFMGITTVPRPLSYFKFVINLMFWVGVSFQFPLVVFALAGLGLIQYQTLLRGWRIAIIAIAVLAAAITPTIDPVNMALVMAPMIILFFLSIFLAWLAGRLRGRAPSTPEGPQPA
jgi:sec-independent protein translocase protein TatC